MTPLTDSEITFIESLAESSEERLFLTLLIDEVRLSRGLLRHTSTGHPAVADYLSQCEGEGTRGWLTPIKRAADRKFMRDLLERFLSRTKTSRKRRKCHA